MLADQHLPERGLQKNHQKPFGHTYYSALDQLVKNSLTECSKRHKMRPSTE
jgi:hypothetical protein